MNLEPNHFEDELRSALRRQSAPPDFAAKVLAAVQAQKPQPRVLAWRRPATLALAASLFAVAVLPAAYFYQRREQQRAQEAGEQLKLALTITHEQLQQTKEIIRHNTRH